MTQTPADLPVYEKLSLNKHAVIQASAGTGKTYTVERLVLRYLLQADTQTGTPKYKLDDILLVTFTEKATGELKERIRSFISAAVDELREHNAQAHELTLPAGPEDNVLPPELLLPHLESQLQSFDRAQIFTIHGFCSKVIKEHAFYCNMPMQMQMTDGKEIMTRVLRDYLNSDPKLSADSVKSWMNTASNILNQVVDIQDITADAPSVSEDDIEEARDGLLQLEEKLASQIGQLTGLSQDELDALLIRHNLNSKGQPGKVKSVAKPDQEQFLKGLLTLGNLTASNTPVEALEHWLDSYLPKWKNKNNGGFLTNTVIKNLSDNNDNRPNGWQIIALQEALQNCFDTLKEIKAQQSVLKELQSNMELAAFLKHKRNEITALFASYTEQKLTHSELTFNDMIKIVSDEISQPNGHLKTQLQSQYKVGIVDEFQDTSRRQWDIFRSIFIDNNPDDNLDYTRTLIVVGDEKQSIYSFQGSEVSTCLEAIRYITEKSGGQHAALDTNYRSTAPLINAYNALFRSDSWFGEYNEDEPANTPNEKSGLLNGYQDVLAGDDSAKEDEEPPIWLCDLAQFETLAQKKVALRDWTVSAIAYLIDVCGVRPSDVAILVETNAEADDIISELRKRGKPVSRVKEAGLFTSRFNLNVIAALDAIHDHKNAEKIKKLALSALFGTPESDLTLAQSISKRLIEAEKLLADWHRYAQNQQWSALLRSLFEDSQLYDHLNATDKRAVMAYRQLRSYALKRLINEGDDLSTLTKRLRSLYKRDISESEEENIFHKETSSDAIQMLTLHRSKGLEFPYVFIPSGGSGFRTKASDNGYIRVFDENGMKLALNTTDSDIKKQENTFARQEKRRLWYVGVTRAKKLLALPHWRSWKRAPKTCAYEDILGPSIEQSIESAGDNDSQSLFRYFEIPEDYSEQSLINTLAETKLVRTKPEHIVSFNIDANLKMSQFNKRIGDRVWINESASSLMQHRAYRTSHKSLDEGIDDSLEHTQPTAKTFSFPKGANTGNMLHDILEKIHFSQHVQVKEEDIVKKYFPQLKDGEVHDYAQRSRTLLESVKAQTIHIEAYQQSFTLNDVALKQCVAEPQFHFSIDNKGNLFPQSQNAIAGWVQGFIDLMFEHEERYYILDWKSNSLAHYDQAHLDEAMNANQYSLQAALYVKALSAFLQHRHPNEDIRNKLGGTIYVFLRARENKADAEGESGIWFATPEQLEALMPTSEIHRKFIEKLPQHQAGMEVNR